MVQLKQSTSCSLTTITIFIRYCNCLKCFLFSYFVKISFDRPLKSFRHIKNKGNEVENLYSRFQQLLAFFHFYISTFLLSGNYYLIFITNYLTRREENSRKKLMKWLSQESIFNSNHEDLSLSLIAQKKNNGDTYS